MANNPVKVINFARILEIDQFLNIVQILALQKTFLQPFILMDDLVCPMQHLVNSFP